MCQQEITQFYLPAAHFICVLLVWWFRGSVVLIIESLEQLDKCRL